MQNSRLKLYFLVLITVLPMVFGWAIYHFYGNLSFKTSNYGRLIHPAVTVDSLALSRESKKQWQIIYIPSELCQTACQEKMFQIHQLRKAMGKNESRIALLLVLNEQNQNVDTHDFRKVIFTTTQIASLKSKLHLTNDKANHAQLFLMDPLGNIFMYYSEEANLMDVLKDLKHVLEVSQIG